MDALGYEFLVRMAYNCGRNYGNGADADIYRKMERAFIAWEKTADSSRDKEDKEYEYRGTAAKVKTHIWDAINKALPQIYNTADAEELQALKSHLHMEEYSKKVIDEVIEEASKIFRKNDLQAR